MDVIGEVMSDAYRGDKAVNIIERDDGFTAEEPGAWFLSPFEEWPDCQREAISEVKGKTLIIGCGSGRVALYVQDKGHDVVGIDISPKAIAICKERGLRDARLMSAEELTFDDNSFDTILLYGNTFGILGRPEFVVEMLNVLYRITTKDAVILAETTDPEAWKSPNHVEYSAKNKEKGNPPGLWKMRRKYKGLVSDWSDILFASPELMEDLAAKAGWHLDHYVGDRMLYIGVLRKV
ncbi:MAG: class I SAM-dependent methyltransferase [Candidatus Thorarchaeota archaeon]